MRIDDLNRTAQTQEAEKTGAVTPERGGKLNNGAADALDSDAATISPLAAQALDASLSGPAGTRESRIEQLRLQIQRGEYHVSAEEVAASIIDQHKVG